MKKFSLIYQSSGKPITLGTLVFNGGFVFELRENIAPKLWERVGIIPVDAKTRKSVRSEDLFPYVNLRLPIALRKSPVQKKVEYIERNGLRTPSDSFSFVGV